MPDEGTGEAAQCLGRLAALLEDPVPLPMPVTATHTPAVTSAPGDPAASSTCADCIHIAYTHTSYFFEDGAGDCLPRLL